MQNKNSVFSKFKRWTTFLVFFLLVVSSFAIINEANKISRETSKNYAGFYNAILAGELETYINRELALVNKEATNGVIVKWLEDEQNVEK